MFYAIAVAISLSTVAQVGLVRHVEAGRLAEAYVSIDALREEARCYYDIAMMCDFFPTSSSADGFWRRNLEGRTVYLLWRESLHYTGPANLNVHGPIDACQVMVDDSVYWILCDELDE